MNIDNVLVYLDDALLYLIKKKAKAHYSDDIWHIRYHWPRVKAELCEQLLNGTFVFSDCRVVEYKPKKFLHTFRTQDMLILKALALALNQRLPKSALCYSWKGHGGVTKTLKEINDTEKSRFFTKTDVADYYATIDHHQLCKMLSSHIQDNKLWRVIYNALKNHNREIGVPRGSPLSHVIGNFYLHELDSKFEQRESQHYFRYMDDILLLADKKGALRRGIKTVKQDFNQLNVKWAIHKSFIGKTCEHNIVFLGQSLFGNRESKKEVY